MVEPEESDHYPRIDVPDLDHEQVVVEEEDSGEWDNTAQDEPGEEGIFAHDLSVAQRRHTWKRVRLHGGLRAGHDTDHVHIYVSAANANDLHPECTNPKHRLRSESDWYIWVSSVAVASRAGTDGIVCRCREMGVTSQR